MHTENFRSSAAPPIIKDGIPNSHRRLSFQRCPTNCQGQVLQPTSTPKTFVPALLHQLSKTEDFLQFTGFPKSFVPALLHQLSRTGSHIQLHRTNCQGHFTTVSRQVIPALQRCPTNCHGRSNAPPTVKDEISNSHRRISFQRCSTNCQGQVLSNSHRVKTFAAKTFAPALLHQRQGQVLHGKLSSTCSTTEDRFSNSHQRLSFQAAPQTVKDGTNSHRTLSFQRCSTNCQGFPIHTEDFRVKIVKDRFSDSHRRLWFQRCSTNCQGHRFSQKTRSSAAPPTVFQLHRKLSLQRCSTNCQGPACATGQGQVLSNSHRRLSPALLPPTVRDKFSNSHRKLSSSTNCQGCSTNSRTVKDGSKTGSPIRQFSAPVHTSRTGPIVTPKTSLQRCPTNCQGQVLQFTPKTSRSDAAPPTVKDRFSNSHRFVQFTPKTFRYSNSLVRDLNSHRSCFTVKDGFSNFLSTTVKDRFSNSHRRLSFQRCSTNCQGQVLQFTPKTFVPALIHQLSRTSSPIHTEDFRSSAAPPTTGSPIRTEDFRSSVAPPTVKDRFSNSHRRLSFQRCSTNCQGQVLQFAPKTFVPALLHQLSRTSSPIHFEDFRSSVAPPTVKDKFSNSHRKLSFQHARTSSPPTEDFRLSRKEFTSKTFSRSAPPTRFSNSHRRLSRSGSPIPENFRSSAAPNCQGQVLQFTPKNFRCSAAPPTVKDRFSNLHAEDFRCSAAPPTVKDRFSISLRKLSIQRCSTNCQGQ